MCLRHGISKLDLEKVRPSTPIQSGILAAFLRSNGSMYFNSIEMQIPAGPNDATLRKAWGAVVAKYEMLRTGFSNVNNPQHPFAMLTYHKDFLDPSFEVIEEDSLEDIAALSEQANSIGSVVLKSLFLPPWRFLVIKRPHHSWTIRLFMLHALFDATSLQLIQDDLAKSYRGEILSQAPPIEPLLNLILIESASNADSKRAFWQDTMKDFSTTKFPNTTALHVKSTQTFAIERMCAMSLRQIQEKCKEMEVTLQSAGQASWARILSIYTGESAVTFGSGKPNHSCYKSLLIATVFSGRINLEATELTPFPSIVTLPICTRVDGCNRELLDKLMKNQSSLLKYQFTPLSKIQRWIGHQNEALFDTLFVYQDATSQIADDTELGKVQRETATADVCGFYPENYMAVTDEHHSIRFPSSFIQYLQMKPF